MTGVKTTGRSNKLSKYLSARSIRLEHAHCGHGRGGEGSVHICCFALIVFHWLHIPSEAKQREKGGAGQYTVGICSEISEKKCNCTLSLTCEQRESIPKDGCGHRWSIPSPHDLRIHMYIYPCFVPPHLSRPTVDLLAAFIFASFFFLPLPFVSLLILFLSCYYLVYMYFPFLLSFPSL